MLRYFLAFSALLSIFATSVTASTLVAPVGVSDGRLAVVPPSTLIVTFDVVTESVTVGPYARYAQKLLGMRAPLVEKSTVTIAGADIKLAAEGYHMVESCCSAKSSIESVVSPLSIDAVSGAVLPAETAAERAAAEIFKIRRTRREMVMGDLGEGYFGAGLEAALARLDLDEQLYLELFMGRTTTTRESRKFEVALDGDNGRYIVCRYSPQVGIVDSSDLTAEPIILQITPSGAEPTIFPSSGDKTARVFRVADQSTCQLFNGTTPLCSSVIPLFEFGYNVSSINK